MQKVLMLMIISMGLLLTGCSAGVEQSETPQVGRLAPDFTLPNLAGQSVSLSDARGKPVLLNFWASWCNPCRAEIPYIEALNEGWLGQAPPVALLAINVGESPVAVKEFMERNNLSFTVLLDMSQEVALKYNLPGLPTTFLIDEDGVIRDRKVGPFRSVAEIESGLDKIMP